MNQEEFTKQMREIAEKTIKIVSQGNYPNLKIMTSVTMGMFMTAHIVLLLMKHYNLTLEQALQRQEKILQNNDLAKK